MRSLRCTGFLGKTNDVPLKDVGEPQRTNRGMPVRAKDRQPGTKKPGEIMQEDLNAAVMATRRQPASQGRKRQTAAPATLAQPGKPAARQGKLRRTDVRP